MKNLKFISLIVIMATIFSLSQNIKLDFKTLKNISIMNIEALSDNENYYIHNNCLFGIEEVEDGEFYILSCNEIDFQKNNQVNECKQVYTTEPEYFEYGMCYSTLDF